MRRRKVSVIGSGFTGATTALLLAQKNIVSDILLVDIPNEEKKTKGKALDMMQTSPIYGFDTRITGTSNYADTVDSDIVIITAGLPRKPGMSRDDLVTINANIMKTITKEVVKYSPECVILVLTNPVDAMTYTVYKESGFPKNRVLGQSGILDTARFCTFVAEELNLSAKHVTGFILGGHGDDMVPLIRYSYAGGIPIETLIPKDRLDAIVQRTRLGGGEIVSLLGDGSAYYAPAASLVEMTEAILLGQRRIVPAIAYLEGEYGYNNIYLGVPTIIGRDGVEGIIELELTNEEKSALDQSVESVKEIINIIK